MSYNNTLLLMQHRNTIIIVITEMFPYKQVIPDVYIAHHIHWKSKTAVYNNSTRSKVSLC